MTDLDTEAVKMQLLRLDIEERAIVKQIQARRAAILRRCSHRRSDGSRAEYVGSGGAVRCQQCAATLGWAGDQESRS